MAAEEAEMAEASPTGGGLDDTVLGIVVDDQVAEATPTAAADAQGAEAAAVAEAAKDDTIRLPKDGSQQGGSQAGGSQAGGSQGRASPGGGSRTSSVSGQMAFGVGRVMRKSSSTPSSSVLGSARSSLSSTTRRKTYGAKRSPLAVPPPFDLPVVDQFGFPCAQVSLLDESAWDERHQLNGSENELKPKGIRDYFARVQTMKELKRDLKYNPHLCNTAPLLKSLALPEINDRKPSFICPDAGPPLVPTRHVFGGSMKDRDGEERMWNDRWHKGISILNDNCHPDHRAYFTQKSLFEESPSQDWRRYMDQEVAHGVWKTISCKKKDPFQPLGGRLRGRSGTPIPGATD